MSQRGLMVLVVIIMVIGVGGEYVVKGFNFVATIATQPPDPLPDRLPGKEEREKRAASRRRISDEAKMRDAIKDAAESIRQAGERLEKAVKP